MSVSEAARHALYARLEQMLGPDETSTLMELLPPVGWGDIARRDDQRLLAAELRGEMADLRTEMAGLRTEMADLRSELRGEMAELRIELRGEVAALRADIATSQRNLALTLVTTMLALNGAVAATVLLA